MLFLTAMIMGGMPLFISFYLQSVEGLSPFGAAMWLLPQMIAMIVASNLGPWLGGKIRPERVVLGSLLVLAAGFALFVIIPSGHGGLLILACASVLTTAGIGACFPYLMTGIISMAPGERAGSAASLAQIANELGVAAIRSNFPSVSGPMPPGCSLTRPIPPERGLCRGRRRAEGRDVGETAINAAGPSGQQPKSPLAVHGHGTSAGRVAPAEGPADACCRRAGTQPRRGETSRNVPV